MDIKLKNRHRIGILLAAVTVLTAAAVMVGLYPCFEKKAEQNEDPVYEDEFFLQNLMSGSYVLSLDAESYKRGEVISPFQFFLPGADEELKSRAGSVPVPGTVVPETAAPENRGPSEDPDEYTGEEGQDEQAEAEGRNRERDQYLEELRSRSGETYEGWKNEFENVREFLDYQVWDKDGTILLNRAGEPEISGNDEYVFRAVLRYDELGRMEVTEVNGKNTAFLLNRLHDLGDSDPLENVYRDDYRYDPKLQMANPKDITIAYGMNRQQADALQEARSNVWSAYESSDSFFDIFFGMLCAVGVLALLFSCFDVRLAERYGILRMPFEPVIAVAFTSLGVSWGAGLYTRLVALTNKGDLYNGLLQAGFLPEAVEIMVKLWNFLWWILPFAVVYWAVLCLRDVFHIGLRRYFRERTLAGKFCGWVKNVFLKMYGGMVSIDLKKHPDKEIFRIVAVNFVILALLSCLWFFGIAALVIYSVGLFLVLKKYYMDLNEKYGILLNAANEMAEGNLEGEIKEDLGVFEPLKEEMQKIQSGFKVAVEEEVKSQRLKTDLISNMSHDLKTPLTAIITYVNLLKDENTEPEQRRAYIDILEQKSMRLKSLIEDLFEISKANSNNVSLNLSEVDIVSLLKEVSLELADKMEESAVDFRWNLPEEKIVLSLDSQKTYRIFDNLLTNIIKYAMPHTRAYIDMKRENGEVVISLKNMSAAELNFSPEEITERFVRGDLSRNTEGSGLGMAIAKSFAELQNGKFSVETEADLFRVIIRWPLKS